MADVALLGLIAERLVREPPPDGAAGLVVAALNGEEQLRDALESEAAPDVTARVTPERPRPVTVYLSSIEVEGFRGIGPAATLPVASGPGLTLVVGRNGSGKSSFSEALEMVLLGTNHRWLGRTRAWTDGWQNLHHRRTRITATFTVEGRRQPLVVTRAWGENAALEGSEVRIGGRPGAVADLGWAEPLSSHPPLLSHNELEHALDEGPSRLYDALAGILGLGELADAQRALRQERLRQERARRDAQDAAGPLRERLLACDDERAGRALAALSAKSWDIAAFERVVSGLDGSDERSALVRLRNLASLPVLDSAAMSDAVEELRAAANDTRRRSESDAARAHETALLLEQALAVHAHGEDRTCTVCGTSGVLTYEWRTRTAERIMELRAQAADVEQARRRAGAAVRRARQLVTAVPTAVREGGGLGLDTAPVLEAWQLWTQLPEGDDPVRLASHLEVRGAVLRKAIAALRRSAGEELERREASWRPAAQAIVEWLPAARAAVAAEVGVRRIKDAERWLRDAHDELRDERFRPIANAVQENWTELRQDSSVSLGELRLEGTSTQRRLKLDVTVDGQPGSALGVMSQGELNCLALSLFLPRASMSESPFHFVVVDDPVQAMDPAKVEGLATVLARTAKQRQVVVLTHDDRLADAMRFLEIDATVVEVTRRENSVVELRGVQDPVRRYIDDAFAVARSEGLPAEAVRVVPGFCRLALEAACALAATRRMLREGRRYADVQSALGEPTTLNTWLALALFGDAGRGGDVGAYLDRKQPGAAQTVRDCNRGAHGETVRRDLVGLIHEVERLTRILLESS